MRPIDAVIVDDEEFAVIDIREHLIHYPTIRVVATYANGLEGLQGINEQRPDLAFVDIEMPEMNGFEMLGRLTHTPVVIFCTGHGRYAIDGYAYDPTDFLLKPLKQQRFQLAMERAIKDIERRNLEERLQRQKQQLGYLLLEYRDLHGESRRVHVWPEDIVFVQPQENNANYIEYYLADGTCHVVKQPLKKALANLEPRGFIQVHRSFLVNTARIREFRGNETLILRDGEATPIPVSRGFRKTVREHLKGPL
jgi:two-component system, LytTR family, response regulator